MSNSGYGFPKLGTVVTDNGVNFAMFCKNCKKIALKIYKSGLDSSPVFRTELNEEFNKTGDIWHIFLEECSEGTIYLWEIDGYDILDPYAAAFTESDSCEKKKNIVIKRDETKYESHLNLPWEELIVYEAHIGMFTKHYNSDVEHPGTYTGFMEKIPYLKSLGITAVEFLPIYEWDDFTGSYNHKSELLKNVWGYNPINFFALTKKYASEKTTDSYSEIEEFKRLVKELHNHGMEVILDVVYNHTAEGGNGGKDYNFKIMSKKDFYILDNVTGNYSNYSGCGNTFNCNRKVSKDMILESLRYWYLEIGVDGFRFDLAPILGRNENGQWGEYSVLDDIAEDPILSHCKLISESWDLGGYYVGDMPQGWSEWNGKYRDVVRKFIKGDFGQISELLKRIFGSSDMFGRKLSNPYTSINFITCHDGFTLHDLVSYNTKHNLDNGEDNRDGESNNNSYNWGEEGDTDDPQILEIRRRQIKNFMLILFISQGVPMILMGDEMGRTQYGNNNAYCQDNALTWVDWSFLDKNRDIFEFVQNMIKLRKKYTVFQNSRYLECDDTRNGDIILHGIQVNKPDLSYHSLSIAFELLDKDSNTTFYIALNSYYKDLYFELPQMYGKNWRLVVDTSKPDKENFLEAPDEITDTGYRVKARSCVILKRG
ncbi:Glycogen operon protein GlgX [Fusobacterium sp. DD29]|uniref:glycogen debranching protein n=1 Tax=unclassified Fusobacterium TaxID=2648384 RepID=UPI001B8A8F8D|nr:MULTISPECIES: alpha-amylase family glycosyl hydrolase [unclassified Fusobacterium]MBR8701518.1 Glycogen operon protein GlgX [Fusobacterium sp. DD45]MBR8711250.1 Glycogen operon protein GlgX [Fusobacterium sp. DD28]MBR8750097.1 Glycogen operon protein GlgX [Fusobacterium sp. DD29]MBR8751799.1 Glycogen operon protein GlgX [Fusobacterium sp. DD26]MBR8762339.1 Glycogen operon protein GlgX [Fusobacterium sp. DD25]